MSWPWRATPAERRVAVLAVLLLGLVGLCLADADVHHDNLMGLCAGAAVAATLVSLGPSRCPVGRLAPALVTMPLAPPVFRLDPPPRSGLA